MVPYFTWKLELVSNISWMIASIFKAPCQQLGRHINNIILKETLQLKILRTWINILANSFIKTWVNIMKWKLMKLHNSLSLDFVEHFTRINHTTFHLFIFFFSFHLVFKFNIAMIGILNNFRHPKIYAVPLCLLSSKYISIYLPMKKKKKNTTKWNI